MSTSTTPNISFCRQIFLYHIFLKFWIKKFNVQNWERSASFAAKKPNSGSATHLKLFYYFVFIQKFTFTSINSQSHRPISFSCFTSPETRGLSPQNPTGRPCVCWLPGAFCQGELRQSCNYRTISCIPLTNCSYCFETINPTMFSLNNTLQHTKSFVRVKPHSLYPPPTLHMFHLSVSSVGWSDFWRQQIWHMSYCAK